MKYGFKLSYAGTEIDFQEVGEMKSKYLGIVLLVIGVALAWWGYNIYEDRKSVV